MLILYDYYRSSCSYRVRIALNLKQLDYKQHCIHLVNNGGEQHHTHYQQINPQELVPTLIDHDITITQSLAIIDYLDHRYPGVSFLPDDLPQRARCQQIANIIACDTHPLNNLRVLQYLQKHLEASAQQRQAWYQHWIHLSFTAIEQQLSSKHSYCCGNTVSLADICLIPQIYNAQRYDIDLNQFPKISAVNSACLKLPAFYHATPEKQAVT